MGGDGAGLILPEPPLIAAGAIGGPCCMYLVTPFRNALTYASKDASLSLGSVFGKVFQQGVKGGWTGGIYPAVAACPQYLCLGPMYHFYSSFSGTLGGIALTGVTETMVLYGAETRNAQLAINARGGSIPVNRIQSPFNPIGPGTGIHIARNMFVMTGMRLINEPIAKGIEKAAGSKSNSVVLLSDLVANCCGAAITMPMHMLYQYTVTTHELWDKPRAERIAGMKNFLRDQYFPGGRPSSVIMRDLALRAGYIATAFTMYMQIERAAVKHWPKVVAQTEISFGDSLPILHLHKSCLQC